jgi:WD40 repeat protein
MPHFGGEIMPLRVLMLIGFLTLWAVPAPAQQAAARPPQEPILRIDPGMHTAPITRIGADAACRLLATASHDKTVRLWRVPQGKLIATLRAPIGPGFDGKVASVAVAPDGTWVAADAMYPGQGAAYVHIFQTATGAMLARLGPLSEVVTHLAVSPDGRRLAATLAGGHGLRVWERVDAATWRLVLDDRAYGGENAQGAAFDRAGTLFTVARDGKLRRYAPGSAKPDVRATRAGLHPFSVAVHPSGDRVAVGYSDKAAVGIYDARTLAPRFAADTTGLKNGHVSAVAWSNDGTRLYAGGTYPDDKRSMVVVWAQTGTAAKDVGKGSPREIVGPTNTIGQLLPCGDGIAVAAQDPAFGILAPDGSRRLWQESVQADLRTLQPADFAVSADGRRVRFALGERGASPVVFDLATEELSAAPSTVTAAATQPPGGLAPADTTGLPVTDWRHAYNPKLNGARLDLDPSELSRSLAIAPDRERFVLGTEWSLRAYGKDGKRAWIKPVPGTAWGVNVARDGKLLVVAYGDGTIRWHRLDDGAELLALFVHAKDQRWVAWTPKGYYMASPGAEKLIGWHVNGGWHEAAQFFSVDRFRNRFNRPDIVKEVLETLDEEQAIEATASASDGKRALSPMAQSRPEEDVRAIAPPTVVIQTPEDNATFRTQDVTIEYNVFSPTGQKITKVDYLINNAALGARFAVPPVSQGKFTFSGKVSLPLPPEDVTVTLVAYEGDRASEPRSIRLRWDGVKPGQAALPRLRALFVGVNDYASPKLTKLRFAAKDATDLAAFFKAQEGKSYVKVETKTLPDASRIAVLNGLEWLERESEEGDVNLMFLAGHGATVDQSFYFLAAESDPEALRATAISKDEILHTIRNRKGSMVVMLDACHSGASAEATTGASGVDMNRLANELGDQSLGVLLYASARGRQYSFEHEDWQNGAFTRAMIEGLSGAADRDKVGYVDTEELSVFVRRRVLAMTKDRQEPVRVKPDAAPEMKIVLLK